MSLVALAFYAFAFITVAAGFMVIVARNPVHSVLFLILAFFSSAALFLLLGAEFLAMILVIVYVGAVAVLFLFVVMMLDINFVALREGFARYLPVGAAVGIVVLIEILFVAMNWRAIPGSSSIALSPATTNTKALGLVLYTDYIYAFQAAGLILLVAMIGAIVLTLRHRPDARRQKIAEQVGRRAKEAIEIRKVKPGEGI
ncbi:MAG: NADH-quinone oxidoreductase subunit J [Rhodothalassiaceae bacterium]